MAGEKLVIVEGGATGTEITLDDELLIGREEPGVGSLDHDPQLSRRHARISRAPDGASFMLEDLGSLNGTYLNGWKIPEPQILSAKDRVLVGSTTLELVVPATSQSTVVRRSATQVAARPAAAPEQPQVPAGPILQARGISKSYGQLSVLKGVDLEIEPGEISGLLGPNGAGKTSFVSIVAGLRKADTGSVSIAGVDALANSRQARRHLGIAPQDLGIYTTLSVRRNLEFFGELSGLRGKELKTRAEEVAEALGLTAKLDAAAATLSGGQQRRLHTGMALLHKPQLLILDEPTVGADIRSRQQILDFVKHLASEGHAICYSTHYLPEIEALGASVAILEGGKIIARGAIAELVSQHGQQALELRFDGPAPELELDGDVTREGDLIRVKTNEPTAVAARALTHLGSQAMRLKNVEIIQPSLESVYLALTERRYTNTHVIPRDTGLLQLAPPGAERAPVPAAV